jgi:hypothetical protein
VLALAEAIPDVLFGVHTELRGIAAAVNGARTAQAVAGAFEGVQNTVMFQHLFHGNPGTDVPEINERFLGHEMTPFKVRKRFVNRAAIPILKPTMPEKKWLWSIRIANPV